MIIAVKGKMKGGTGEKKGKRLKKVMERLKKLKKGKGGIDENK